MARQRKRLLPFVTAWFGLLTLASRAETPDILLPQPFAVELPAAAAGLSVDDAPMRALLAGIQAGGDRVTAELPRDRIGPGAWRVILSAWEAGVRDRPMARRDAVLFVLPHGMTPVGETGIGGGARIAHDADGFVHMVWTDGWRAGAREGAMYRRGRVLADGTPQFDSDIIDLAPHRGNWTAAPALAAAAGTIHFAWRADGTIRYRFLTRSGADWQWSDEIDTKAQDSGTGQGPAIAADKDAVYILTPDGHCMISRDGGRTWTVETVPFGTYSELGTVSLSIDTSGHPLVAATVLADNGNTAGAAIWTARLARRIGTGAWQALPGPLGRDLICQSFEAREDVSGAIHAIWDGAPAGGSVSGVQAYYAWRSPAGEWGPPMLLAAPDPVHGLGKSFATGMILDRDTALPLVSLILHSGWRYRGGDAELRRSVGGTIGAPPLTVTSFVRGAMAAAEPSGTLSASLPTAAPALFRSPDGRVWADTLVTLDASNAAAPGVIVWRHLEVTDWLRAADR